MEEIGPAALLATELMLLQHPQRGLLGYLLALLEGTSSAMREGVMLLFKQRKLTPCRRGLVGRCSAAAGSWRAAHVQ